MNSRTVRTGTLVVALAAALVTLAAIALPAVGLFLVVADPLRPSDAIFVLDGSTPARELEAAALYHRRLAPRVALSRARDALPEITRRLAGEPPPQEHSARVLQRAGVPARAIVRLTQVVENTDQELRAGFELARAQGFRHVILVTSSPHTRRVRLIWRSRYGERVVAMVHPTSYERFRPERWWQSRRYLEWSLHEIFGIASFYLGAPIRTFDRDE